MNSQKNTGKKRPLEIEERETQLLVNDADMADNFFIMDTNKRNDYRAIVKRIGKDNILDIRVSYDQHGNEIGWYLRIPARFFSRRFFGLKKS